MKAPYQDDPEWQAAQADIVTDPPGESDVQALIRRLAAAYRLGDIEARYSDGGGHE